MSTYNDHVYKLYLIDQVEFEELNPTNLQQDCDKKIS